MLSVDDAQKVTAVVAATVPIDALWVFGSEAKGEARAGSDVDVAALFSRNPTRDELLSIRAALTETLRRDVDLIDLKEASPVVARQVLRDGRLLAEHNRSSRVAFASALPARYEDLIRVRRPVEEALLRRLAHG